MCEMTYNYATWSQIHPFTKESLRRKYSLYRYSNLNHTHLRHGSGKTTSERRIVLFLPGHGGDYHQARSLFQRASETLFDLEEEISRKEGNLYLKFSSLQATDHFSTFEFLSIDFGEEATALLGGAAVRDQAEYVHDCISHIVRRKLDNKAGEVVVSSNVPTITVVAHSMGGLAAKLAAIKVSDFKSAISSIVTLSSPHLAPPVQIDVELAQVYQDLRSNGWKWSYDHERDSLMNAAQNVALFAISGGEKDSLIWEPLTQLNEPSVLSNHISSLQPPWLSISSRNIPAVKFSIDHQAILWCRQLLNPLALSVLLATSCGGNGDACSPHRRLGLFREGMGLEDVAESTSRSQGSVLSVIVGQDIDLLFSGTYSLRNTLAAFPVRFLSPFLVSLFVLSFSLIDSHKLWIQIKRQSYFSILFFSSTCFLFMCFLTFMFGEHYHAHPVTVTIVTTLAFACLYWPLFYISSFCSRKVRDHQKLIKFSLSLLLVLVSLFSGMALLSMYEPTNGRQLIESFILIVIASRSIIFFVEELVQWPQHAVSALGASLSLFPCFIGPIARALEILIKPFCIRTLEEGLLFRFLEKGVARFSFDFSVPYDSTDRILVTSTLHLFAYPYFLKALKGNVDPDDKHQERDLLRSSKGAFPRIVVACLVIGTLAIQGWNDASILPLISSTIAAFYTIWVRIF